LFAQTAPYSQAELDAIPIVPPLTGRSVTKRLFDDRTLNEWRGNWDRWSVRDGAIVGKFNAKVPTSFLFTDDTYSDFRLTLSSQMVESDNHADVCFRGEIAAQGHNRWYTHGPLVIFPNPSMWDYNAARGLRMFRTTTEKVTAHHDWVRVEILAQGNRVRSAFNGVQVMEWREADTSRIEQGPIRRSTACVDGCAGSALQGYCGGDVSAGRPVDYGWALGRIRFPELLLLLWRLC
jgi:hypothetical protein